jgi:N-acetylglucosamine malate deacetylase 2
VLHRAAFWTIRAEEAAEASDPFHLTGSKAEDIDVVMMVDAVDVERQRQALDCYVTYRETIEKAGARRSIPREAVFEIYQEAHDPPLDDLLDESR